MQKTTYEEFKYALQDTGRIYVGCKYSFKELLDNDELNFKFRLIMEKYILPECKVEADALILDSHLYYLSADSFLVKIYKQMKSRIKVNVLEEKRGLFGKTKKRYVTKTFTIDDLVALSTEQKQDLGLVIQELSVSKLALLSI